LTFPDPGIFLVLLSLGAVLSTTDTVGEFDKPSLCHSSPWWAADSFQSPTSLPQTQQVRGDPSGEVPLRRVPQAGKDASLSRDVPLQHGLMRLKMATTTGTKTGRFLIGAFQDQVPSGRFVLPLGSFGRHLGSF
jgi:hypothetical protein